MLIRAVCLLILAPGTAVAVAAPDPARPVQSFEAVDRVVDEAIAAGGIRGAVLVIGRGPDVLHLTAHGERAPGVPMTTDTVFDMASLTKPVATASSIMKLIEQGRLRLADLAQTYVPELTAKGAETITIEHLLIHVAGLAPANPTSDFDAGVQEGLALFGARDLRSTPGEKFRYSDLGYITLGTIVERVTGQTLAEFSSRAIHAPLGMSDTGYGPLTGERLARCAPTERGVTVGIVHDPRSAAMGGIAGHAGLFSTGSDVARFCSMLTGQPQRAFKPATVTNMIRPRVIERGSYARGLGLDIVSRYDSPRGALFPRYTSFGHTGFTGPCFWVDRASGAWYVLMLSRLQVEPAPSVSPLRRSVADAVARALQIETIVTEVAVRCGIDVLALEDCKRLAGRRVGLITNTTGRARDGRRTIDVLHESSGVALTRLFSPEHGLFAKVEGSVGDAVDEATGLPVFSLYGDTRKPTPEMLDGLDAVVFDIQDIGVRFYTYISTLGLVMEACAEKGIPVIVLDRPNPITGTRVEGPIIDPDRQSFIGWRPLPVTHGMTVGELARMFQKEWGGIPCDLEIVEVEGWSRSMWWEETGVRWINPSPNMRNPTQAVLYPCVGLLEGANLSVGRGTDEPFERFGAPWIDGPRLCDALRAAHLPGLEFAPIEFTPDTSKFDGELCQGVQITVTDRDAFQPVISGLAMMWTLDRLFGNAFEASKGDARLRSRRTWEALLVAEDWRAVPALWRDDVTRFRRLRSPYLIYGDER